jgi:NAD(P)H dehydrogenase (quinone)
MSFERPTTAITGSTGVVGGLVARELSETGMPLRLLVRDTARAPRLDRAVAEQAVYGQPTSALEGVELLFMVSASESATRLAEHLAFVDAAAAAGVRHIVYTSFLGASADSTFTLGRDHFATEQHIRSSGMDFTLLRDAFYLDFMPSMVGDDQVMRGPAGDGRAAIVAREDVARTAARVLENPVAHLNQTYNLTGPERLSLTEVAATIAEATGTPTTFHNETIEEAYASRAAYGAPDWQVDAWVSTYTAIAAGDQDVESDDVERVTGRVPLSLAEFLNP